ncbi:MAG: acetyltransferase [Gemmatimonadota bacterium]
MNHRSQQVLEHSLNRLAILGASGHGKVVAEAALLSGWKSVVFFDDAWPRVSGNGPWEVLGTKHEMIERLNQFDCAAVAIGDNATRIRVHQELVEAGFKMPAIVHPAAIVSAYAEIGDGSVIAAGAMLNPFSRLGRSTIINTGASIDHDCRIADGVHVSPGAHLGGGVSVGYTTWIGIGSIVKHGISIGEKVVVGAGSVVVNDITDGLTVIGVPARPAPF